MSARATYPQFVPLHENILLQFGWALRGLYDSLRIHTLFSTVTKCVVLSAGEMYEFSLL